MEVFEISSTGFGATIQDRGRQGWRRFGVPVGGVMDDHAASWGNRLLDNPIDAPVVELLLHGALFNVRRDTWIAITGAGAQSNRPLWRVLRVSAGETLEFPRPNGGVWTYLSVEGGFDAPRWLGSASACARAGIGGALQAGDVLHRATQREFRLPEHVAARVTPWTEQRHYSAPPPLRIWPGPQWDSFAAADRERFFSQEWKVTSQSDRVGYRLSGDPLRVAQAQMISEPVCVGTIQVPENGLPIVTLRDGPTVGGYPKLGVIDPADLSWLVQCGAGQSVRFRPAHET